MNKHMIYTCLAGVGGIIVILAGSTICAFGVDNGQENSAVHSNDTVVIKETTEEGLSLMALSGAVIIGFGSFVVIVSSVVFFEQRDKSIKDKINAEEKAKKKRGYKHKPKKKTAIEQVIQAFRNCIDECSKPIKLKEIEKKEPEATDVITAQPTPVRKPSESGSMTSVEKVLDNLPEFQTIDFLYRDDHGAGETVSQDEDLLLDKEERLSVDDKNSFGSQTSFTKMEELMAKEEEDESVSQAASYSDDHDSVFTDDPHENASGDERRSNANSDDGRPASEAGMDGDEPENTEGDDMSTTSKHNANKGIENNSEKKDESTNNDMTDIKDGVILVQEKKAAANHPEVLTPGRLPPVHPRRLPLISDNVERLTCGIARTNAQAMDRARKPLPLPEILDSCP